MSFQSVAIADIQSTGPDLFTIRLDLGNTGLQKGHVSPGQFVQITVGDHKPGFFAIASAPSDRPTFEFLIKRSGGAAGAIVALSVGDTVQCSDVMGKGFDLSGADRRPVVAIATGTGISAIRSVLESRQWDQCTLLYGARNQEQASYKECFSDWSDRGVEVVCTLSSPNAGWDGAKGHVQELIRGRSFSSDAITLFCGQREMVEDATKLLKENSMSDFRGNF